jgi:hypothetical protein
MAVHPQVYIDNWCEPPTPCATLAAVGDTVKISNGAERFFVTVLAEAGEDGRVLVGAVDNFLVGSAPYTYGDFVSFRRSDIWHVRTQEERLKIIAALQLRLAAGEQPEDIAQDSFKKISQI